MVEEFDSPLNLLTPIPEDTEITLHGFFSDMVRNTGMNARKILEKMIIDEKKRVR